MEVNFYKERDVDNDLIEEVINELKDIPFLKIRFANQCLDLPIPDSSNHQSLEQKSCSDTSEETGFNLNDYIVESISDRFEGCFQWAKQYFYQLEDQIESKEGIIKIHFHTYNDDNWYSCIGFSPDWPSTEGGENGIDPLVRKYVTIATGANRWANIPNLSAAIAHEVLSCVLIACCCNNWEEYMELANPINTGSVNDGLWGIKGADNAYLESNVSHELTANLLRLKVQAGDIDERLHKHIVEKQVDQFIVRDVVKGLSVLRDRNTYVVKEGWNKIEPSKVEIDIEDCLIHFVDIDRVVPVSSITITLLSAYVLANKCFNGKAKVFSYNKFKAKREKISQLYLKYPTDRVRVNGTSNLRSTQKYGDELNSYFSDKANMPAAFRTARKNMNAIAKFDDDSKYSVFAELYKFDENGECKVEPEFFSFKENGQTIDDELMSLWQE